MDVVKVKPWAPDQGDCVIINAEDFVDGTHELVVEEAAVPVAAVEEKVDEEGTGSAGEGAEEAEAHAKPATKKVR